MNGTVKRKLYGSLALGVALALAGAGCVGAPEESEEDVSGAVQQLDSIDSDGSPEGEDAVDDEAGDDGDLGADDGEAGVLQSDEDDGEIVAGPDPLPWDGERPVDSDDDLTADPTTMAHSTSGAPSGGNGGK